MNKEGLWLPRWRSDTEAHIHFVPEVLYAGKSTYQRIEIVRLVGYGKCLILDGIHQSTEVDEFIYHEAIVHPGLCLHPNPRKVLVIGGGEGAVLREVLKHSTVELAVMVEIDRLVVDTCRQYLGWENGAYDDPRAKLIIEDGSKYLQNTDEKFDCIIVDSTTPKPGSIAFELYGSNFLQIVASKLSDGGILCGLQSNANILYLDSHRTIRQMLQSIFSAVFTYTVYCPFYAISYAFAIAVKEGNEINPFQIEYLKHRLDATNGEFRFYDEQTHLHMFNLPKYMREILGSDRPLIDQGDLIKH